MSSVGSKSSGGGKLCCEVTLSTGDNRGGDRLPEDLDDWDDLSDELERSLSLTF